MHWFLHAVAMLRYRKHRFHEPCTHSSGARTICFQEHAHPYLTLVLLPSRAQQRAEMHLAVTAAPGARHSLHCQKMSVIFVLIRIIDEKWLTGNHNQVSVGTACGQALHAHVTKHHNTVHMSGAGSKVMTPCDLYSAVTD